MSMMPMDNDPTGGLLGGLPFNKGYMDSPLFHLGMGLLSVPSQSLNPEAVSWGPGLARGMQSMQQHQMNSGLLAEKQARTQLHRDKIEAAQREAQQEAEERARRAQALEAAVAKLSPEEQERARGLLGFDPEGGKEYVRGLLNPEGPGSMFDLWLESPEKAAQLLAAQEKIKGQFNSQAPRVSIKLPDTEKPVGEKARDYVMPDGTIPSPLMSVRQIVGAGGKVLSARDKEQRKIAAQTEAKEREYERRVNEAQDRYTTAKRNFESNPGATTKRALDQAAFNLDLAKGQQANIAGEPSDFVSRGQNTPGAFGLLFDSLVDEWTKGKEKPLDLGTVPLPGPGGRVKAGDLIKGM